MKNIREELKKNNIKVSPQGIMIVTGNVATAGVLPYQVGDKLVGVLSPVEEIFNEESISSLEGVAVILKDHQHVDENNASSIQIGMVTSVEPNGDFLKIKLAIWDEQAKEQIKSKDYTELSCGYSCDLIEDKGYFFGSPYSYKKKNIKYNHVCVLKEGEARNGYEAKINLDSNRISNDDTLILCDNNSTTIIKIDMKKIKIKDREFEIDNDDLVAAIENLLSEKQIQDDSHVSTAKKITELEKQLNLVQSEKPDLIKLWLKAFPIIKNLENVDYSISPIELMKLCIKDRYPNTEDAEESVIKYLFNNMEIENEKEEKPAENNTKTTENALETGDSNKQNSTTKTPNNTTTNPAPKLGGIAAKASVNFSSTDLSDQISNKRQQKSQGSK